MHISFYLYIIAISIIVGLAFFKRLNPPVIRWFVPFLILTLAVEICGMWLRFHHTNNARLYNVFTSIEFMFYSLVFRQAVDNIRLKKVILYAAIIFPFLVLLNIIFLQPFTKFHTITFRAGSVMVITWCYLYFRQLMRSEEFAPLFKNPFFWISTGLLFFYAGSFFFMSSDLLMYINLPYNSDFWFALNDTLNIILYTAFLISFVCQIKITRK